jgi:hypothetical protein
MLEIISEICSEMSAAGSCFKLLGEDIGDALMQKDF